MTKAIILAAGRGKRMLPLTNHLPKCLLRVKGKTILEHQLDLLRENQISKIFIVTGFEAGKIEQVGGKGISYIYNKDYLSTNSIYSLFLAKDHLDSNVILLNSDVLISSDLMKRLIADKCENGLLVDFERPFVDGEMNVKVSDGYVTEISKTITSDDADGKSAQIVKITDKYINLFRDEVTRLVENNHKDKFPTDAYGPIIKNRGLKAIDTKNEWWFEVDTIEDLESCRSHLPKQEIMV